jgi:hypothetical protein
MKLMVLCASSCFSQAPKSLEHYLEKSNLLLLGQAINVLPDILQDDLGTSYGSLSAQCFKAFEPEYMILAKCPIDTLYSLIYLSTNANKPNIKLKKREFCLLFLNLEKSEENQIIPNYKLTDENAIFNLTPAIIHQLIAINPKFKELNLNEYID